MFYSRRSFMNVLAYCCATVASPLLWCQTLFGRSLDANLIQGNPIVPGKGLCDPQARVYDGHVYLYATHDAVPEADHFITNDWWVWRTNDLVHWEQVSTLKPEDTYWGKPSNQCWATDAISRNGKYYFYFSRGPEEIGVVMGETPHGPWKDPVRKPLIAKGSTPTLARDPGILQEEDGTSYIVFGCWEFYIAKLNEDMISLAETPRLIRLDRMMGPYGPGKTDDKPFLHKRMDKYYLSWGCYYAMSDNVYGPYVYKDSIIKLEHTEPEFQRDLTTDRHGSFFEFHHQWYFICNDRGYPGASAYFRNSVLSYVHYKENGEIAPIELTRVGVGQYDGSAMRISSANYFSSEGVTQTECPEGGFDVRDIRQGSSLIFPNVMKIREDSPISFRCANANANTSEIEIRERSPEGKLLGRCLILPTGSWTSYRSVDSKLKNKAGALDICLTFRGKDRELLRLNWLSFQDRHSEL
jgi:arabinoxylan arabinofuranohydrolase